MWSAPTNSSSSEPTQQTEKLILSPTTHRSSATSSRKIVALPTGLSETYKITMAPSNAASDESLERVSDVEQESNMSSIPEEMAVLIENEKRRAAEVAANISICSSTINIVENHLSPMLSGEHKNFIDSFRVYLRASIAQFIEVGPGAAPLVLSRVPAFSKAKPTTSMPVEIHQFSTAAPSSPKANSWAAIVGKETRREGAGARDKEFWSKLPRQGLKKPEGKKKDGLYPRIPKNYDWRSLSTAGIWVAVISKFGCSPTSTDKILPTAAGFVLIAKDEDVRKQILSCAGRLLQDINLEPARNWASLMLPNIPVHIVSLDGQVTISESYIVSEIERVTVVTPKSVQRDSKSKYRARYCNWVDFFESRSAPQTGFRLFEDLGRVATVTKCQMQAICKRCFG
ncbi:EKA-like protein [Blumeria hordei DH14]|uniref:EKA-like protein n=1 Tax=Blumeria graminis f. sp. hordei (strain DH14) TaxID=546991 RepID=N1JCX6_BLUG1|nr:EKA-like protein [Blumeria hordei DH14]